MVCVVVVGIDESLLWDDWVVKVCRMGWLWNSYSFSSEEEEEEVRMVCRDCWRRSMARDNGTPPSSSFSFSFSSSSGLVE